MVASPEFVYQQLKFYGERVGMWEGKEELEKLLLRRNDKLINLALGAVRNAQVGHSRALYPCKR